MSFISQLSIKVNTSVFAHLDGERAEIVYLQNEDEKIDKNAYGKHVNVPKKYNSFLQKQLKPNSTLP